MFEKTYPLNKKGNGIVSFRYRIAITPRKFRSALLSFSVLKNQTIATVAAAFVWMLMIPAKSIAQLDPASFTATTFNASQINLAATANANGDNIVVVFNTTGSFSAPTNGSAPTGVGTPLAGSGGTIVYDGVASGLTNHTGLTSNTHYFYQAFSYDASFNYSPGVAADAVTCPGDFTTSGGGSYCAGGSGVTITLSGSEAGVSYQLKNGTTNVGSAVAGTGSPLNFNNITSGSGDYTIEAANSDNSCTVVMSGSATVTENPLPIPTFTTSPAANSCASSDVTYTTESGQSGYTWTVPGTLGTDYTISSGSTAATSNTVTIKWLTAGSKMVTVNYTDGNGCTGATPASSTTTVNALVTPTVSIAANPGNVICAGTSVTFTATPVNGGATPSYQWKVNGNSVGTDSPTFTSTTLANTDVVTIVMTSSATCPSPSTVTSNSIKMTVNALVTPSVSISASVTTICPGNSVTFTAAPVNGGTAPAYQWQVNGVNAGGNSSTFSTTGLVDGDVVSVILTSNATCASPTTATSNSITVTVNPGKPAIPGAISGNTPVCPGITALTYTIPAVANATNYTWTVPPGWTITGGQGTTTVTVTSGAFGQNGNISVTASNSCGTSSPSSLALSVDPGTPATPGTITGTTAVCPNITGLTYTIASVTNATSYTWTVPAGWTITGGQGTTTLTVTAGSTGQNGNVTVAATNSCGTSTARTVAVSVSPATPATPGTITGTTPVCPGIANLTYSIASVSNATSYSWSVPPGWTITSGQGTTTVTVTSGAFGQNGNISVTASNSCGTSTPSSLAVTTNPGMPATPGAITGTSPVCPGITGLSYTIATVPNATTYTWTVPAGWTITGGQGTNSVTVTSGAAGQNGNITVTASNSCGTSTGSIKAVTVSPGTPATPGTITGSTEQCINNTSLTYSISAVPNATSYTWSAPAGWNITSGQGNTSIIVSTSGSAISGNITVAASNSCGTSSAQTLAVIVSTAIPSTPSAPTGQSSICTVGQDYTYQVASVSGATSYAWTVPSTLGTINGTSTGNSINVTVPSSAPKNTTSNISVKAQNACGVSASSPALAVTVGNFAFVDAGPDQTVCANSPNATMNSTVGGATGSNNLTWSTSGSGSFKPNNKQQNPTYNPSAADIAAGSVTLTATTDKPSGCNAVTDQLILTIRPVASASINRTTTICSGSATNITFTATANTTVAYKINGGPNQTINIGASGTATINTGNLSANTTYSLVSVDYTTAPTCGQTVSGTAAITVTAAPTANAGSNQSTCSANGAVTITGASATNQTGVSWSTTGSGTFTNGNTLNPTYTPSAADITAGSVTLTLTATGNSPCGSATSTKTLTITKAPTANAGGDQSTCSNSGAVAITGATATNQTGVSWSSTGTGTFTNATTLTPTYTPSAADITAGSVTLTLTATGGAPCGNAQSTKTLTITKAATASAGSNQTSCSSDGAITITGASAANQTGVSWSTTGSGTFTNGNTLNPTYTPSAADITAGSVTLTLTATSNSPCGSATSTKTLTITKAPTANAGGDQSTCSNSGAVAITGASASNQASLLWSTSGTGTFTNGNTLTPAYTPSAADIAAGSVTLTLTATGNSPCGVATSSKLLTIIAAATSNAGADQSTCSNSSAVSITGATATNQASASWSTSGTGTFTNGNTLTPDYTPSAADIAAGSVTLTLTAIGNSPCGNATSTKTLTINKAVVITTQPANVGVCATYPADFNVVATGDQLTYQWYKGTPPSGTPLSNTSNISGVTTADLHFNQVTSLDDGSYYVIVSGASSCASVTSQTITLNVDQPITISSQPAAQNVCEGNTVSFTVTATANGDPLSYQWRKNGSNIPGATSSTYTINPVSGGDAADYDVVITGPSGYACSNAFSAKATLTVTKKSLDPTSATASSSTICNGQITTLTLNGGGGGDNETIHWYSGSCGGTPVGTGNNLSVNPSATTTYYGRYEDGSPCSYNSACASVTITVNQKSADPTSATASSSTICNGQSTTLTLNGGGGGDNETIHWYTGSCGGTSAGTGNNLSVSPTVTTTYFGRYEDGSPCSYNSACVSVTITVNQKSADPTSATASSTTICNGQSTTLTLNGGGGGANETIRWYSGSCGGTPQGAGNNLSVSPTVTTTYFGRYEDAGPCSYNSACASVTITVNQKSADPTSASASSTTICNGQSTTLTLSGGGGGVNETIHWYAGSCGGASVGTGNNLSVSPTVTTTYYGRYEDGAPCSYNSACVSVMITVNQKSANPTSATASISTICNGQSTTLTLNGGGGGANETIHWYSGSCGGTSVGTGNNLSVNPTVTTTYYGRYEDGGPCNFNSGCASVTVTVNQKSADPTSATASASTICAGGSATLTLIGGGGGTGEVVKWYTGSCGGTLVGTGNGFSVSPSATTTYYGRYEDGAPCNYSSNCASVTVTVTSPSVGGTLSPAVSSGCSGSANGTITLTGSLGNILRWESSTNGGATWSTIPNTNGSTSYTYSNLTQTTLYRAVLQNGPCGIAYSTTAVVSVIPQAKPSPVTPSPRTICAGQTSVLSAGTGYPTIGITDSSGYFQQANPKGWLWDGSSNSGNAGADNGNPKPWHETNGSNSFNNITYVSPQPKFAIVDGTRASTWGQQNEWPANLVDSSVLQSPVFSLIGQTSATLNFLQGYILEAGASIKIQISTDGGATYNTTLKQVTGPATLGRAGNTVTLQSDSISLTNYIGLSNLRLRFVYKGTVNSTWGLDNIALPASLPISYQWSDTTAAGSTIITPVTQTPVTVQPTVTTTYTISTYVGGCFAGSDTVTVFVNPLPTISGATTTETCDGANATITVSGLQANTTSTISYNIGGTPGTATVTSDASGNGSFTVPVTYANNGQQLTITSLSNNVTSCGQTVNQPVTLRVNPKPTAVISGDQIMCGGQPATLTVTLTGTPPWSFTYSNGTTTTTVTGVTSSPYTFNVSPGSTTTYTLTTVSDGKCAGGPANVSGSATVTILSGTPGVWTGAADTDWFNCRNWADGKVPTVNVNVTIASTASRPCVINATTSPYAATYGNVATCNNITVDNNSLTFGTPTDSLFAKGSVKIQNDGIVSMVNGGKIELQGDWIDNVTTAGKGFIDGNGSVTFSGGATQRIFATKGTEVFHDLQINKSATTGLVYLYDDVTVEHDLTLTQGIFVTGYNLFTFNNTGTLTQPEPTYQANSTDYTESFIATCDTTGTPINVAGPTSAFQGDAGFRIKNVGNTDTYFPVGASFLPSATGEPPAPNRMMINNVGTPTDFTVALTYGDIGYTNSMRVNRIWYVKSDATQANMKLFYTKRDWTGWGSNENEVESFFDYSQPALIQKDYSGNLDGFVNLSQGADLVSSVGNAYNTEAYAQYTIGTSNNLSDGITTFNRFSIVTYTDIILPVTIINFKAYQQGTGVEIDWSGLDERNLDHYEVQRSIDGISFTTLGNTKAINNGTLAYYRLKDPAPVQGDNYYRIKAVDKNGEVLYTSIARVNICCDQSIVRIYPNPVLNKTFNVQFTNMAKGRYQLLIYNAIGQKILVKTIDHPGGSATETILLSSTIAKGSYFVKVFNQSTNVVIPLVIE